MPTMRERAERGEPAMWTEVELHRVSQERDAAIRDIQGFRRAAERQMRDRVGKAVLDKLRDENER